MTLIIDESGKVVETTDKSIDAIKREPYKHTIREDVEIEEITDEVIEDNPLDDTEQSVDLQIEMIDPKQEMAVFYIQFASLFRGLYPDSDLLSPIETFLSSKKIDVQVDISGDQSNSEVPPV